MKTVDAKYKVTLCLSGSMVDLIVSKSLCHFSYCNMLFVSVLNSSGIQRLPNIATLQANNTMLRYCAASDIVSTPIVQSYCSRTAKTYTLITTAIN